MWLGALVALSVLGALPLLREMGRRPIARRQHAPTGRLVRLSHGKTHLQDLGPADGPVIVLVHGLTTPSFVFDGLTPDLLARGYRVITYDHYGRGLSDRPRIAQDGPVFRAHLREVLAACDMREPATFVGYSMGAAVVSDFAAHHPEKVARLILLAPAGMHLALGGGVSRLLSVPLLGTWLFHMIYPCQLRRGIAADRAEKSAVPDIADRQLEETRSRGFFRLVLASLRGILAAPQAQEHRTIAAADLPVTALFGERDDVIPLGARDDLRVWNPSAQCITVPGAGHGLPHTHVAAVLAAI